MNVLEVWRTMMMKNTWCWQTIRKTEQRSHHVEGDALEGKGCDPKQGCDEHIKCQSNRYSELATMTRTEGMNILMATESSIRAEQNRFPRGAFCSKSFSVLSFVISSLTRVIRDLYSFCPGRWSLLFFWNWLLLPNASWIGSCVEFVEKHSFIPARLMLLAYRNDRAEDRARRRTVCMEVVQENDYSIRKRDEINLMMENVI